MTFEYDSETSEWFIRNASGHFASPRFNLYEDLFQHYCQKM